MHELLDDIRTAGAQLVAVSPNTRNWAGKTAELYSYSFPVLADIKNAVAAEYGLKFSLDEEKIESLRGFLKTEMSTYNGYDAWELPVPATYLIGRDGKVLWVYANELYRQRPTGEHTLEVLRHFLQNRV